MQKHSTRLGGALSLTDVCKKRLKIIAEKVAKSVKIPDLYYSKGKIINNINK